MEGTYILVTGGKVPDLRSAGQGHGLSMETSQADQHIGVGENRKGRLSLGKRQDL